MAESIAATFCAAVDALHAGGTDAVAANAWLMAFVDDPMAPHVCSLILTTPTASVPQQVSAAGILGRAGSHGATSLEPLLHLVGAAVVCPPAVASLAGAVATVAAAAGAEEQLLASASFDALEPSRQLPILHALGECLAQSASVEELRAKPSTTAACRRAVDALQRALELDATSAPALRCLTAWAECGVDFEALRQNFPAVTSALLGMLDPRAVALAPESGRPCLELPALAAGVLRAALESSLEVDEEVTLDSCMALLALVAHWAGSEAGMPAWASVGALGAPSVDATGLSDGGGPDAGINVDLVCHLAAVASRVLELTAEECDDALRGGDAPPAAAAVLRRAFELLLACSAHALPGPSEMAAEGWLGLSAALPPAPLSAAVWRAELYALVVQRTVQRASRAQLRSGTNEDGFDLDEWRERCAAPLLCACSEVLGAARYLAPLAAALGGVLQRGGAHAELEMMEALLFGASCMSGRCARAMPADADAAAGMADLAAAAAAAAAGAAAGAGAAAETATATAIVEQAAACRAALACATSDDVDFEPRVGLGWASLT